jgi:WD40 repeat protein
LVSVSYWFGTFSGLATVSDNLTGYRIEELEHSWLPDDRCVASAGVDRTIKIWDTDAECYVKYPVTQDAQSGLIRRFGYFISGVISALFSSDGKTVVASSADGTVKLWDLTLGTLSNTLAAHIDEEEPI